MAKKKSKNAVPVDPASIHVGISPEDRANLSAALSLSSSDMLTQRPQIHEKTAWMK